MVSSCGWDENLERNRQEKRCPMEPSARNEDMSTWVEKEINRVCMVGRVLFETVVTREVERKMSKRDSKVLAREADEH